MREAASLVLLLGLSFSFSATARAAEPTYGDISLRFDRSDVTIQPRGDGFVDVFLAGAEPAFSAEEAGRPALPELVRWFALPRNTEASDVFVTVAEWDTVSTEGTPVPIPDYDGNRIPESDRYESDDPYPASPIQVATTMDFRGYRLAKLRVSPIRYLPGEEKMILARRINASIGTRPTLDESRILRPEAIDGPHGEVRKLLKAKSANPGEFDRMYPRHRVDREPMDKGLSSPMPTNSSFVSEWPSERGAAVSNVIITSDHDLAGGSIGNVGAWAQDYADWKTWEGVTTVVFSLDEILANPDYAAIDTPATIKAFIRDCVRQWGLLYVTLAGDLDVIPTRRLGAPDFSGGHFRTDPVADFYYAVSGEDWNEDGDAWDWEDTPTVAGGAWDVIIGRLPIRNEADAAVIFRKLREYRDPDCCGRSNPTSDYYQSALLASGFLNSANPAPTNNAFGYNISEAVRNSISTHWPATNLRRLYALLPEWEEECDGTLEQCYESARDFLDINFDPQTDNQWSGVTGLRDNINDGHHLVFHIEHSFHDRIGGPSSASVGGETWLPADQPCGASDPWRSACQSRLDDWADTHWDIEQGVTVPVALALKNGAVLVSNQETVRHSIMVSAGSWTGAMDRRTVGEAMLQSPDGGAVAYMGRTISAAFYADTKAIYEEFYDVLLDDTHQYIPEPILGLSWQWAINEATTSSETWMRFGNRMPLLGDPSMIVWRDEPGDLHVTRPDSIAALGPQTFSVTVRQDGPSGDPVEGAIVVVRQGDHGFATSTTNVNGVATIYSFVVADTSDVVVAASHKGSFTHQDTIDVSLYADGYLALETLEIDDGAGGDDDGVLERGESAKVRATWRNNGSLATTPLALNLRPTPTLGVNLQIGGVYAHDRVFVGSANKTPVTDDPELFSVPTNGRGVTGIGMPTATSVKEYVWLWRDEATGKYTLQYTSPSQSADSTVAGVIYCEAGISQATLVGELGTDLMSAGADSVSFTLKGDASADRVEFFAEANLWLGVSSAQQGLFGSVAADDTVGWSFDVELTNSAPDFEELQFSGVAKRGAQAYDLSNHAVSLRAERVGLAALDVDRHEPVGTDSALVFRPLLTNRGSDDADSVLVVARVVSGTGIVVDSVSTVGRLNAGKAIAVGDSIVVSAADSAALAATSLEFETIVFQRSAPERVMWDGANGSGWTGPDRPQGLVADPKGGSLLLRWDPVTEPFNGEMVDRYLIYAKEGGSETFLGAVPAGTTRYVVRTDGSGPLEALDESGDYKDYEFVVRSCTPSRCSVRSYVTGARVWLENQTGWPKHVPVARTAPLVVDIDGRDAVFVGGRKIHAWWVDDGTPVRGTELSYPDGEFYDPELPDEWNVEFAEALAKLELWDDGADGIAIVGNVNTDAVYCIKIVESEVEGYYDPQLLWKKGVAAGYTHPMVVSLNRSGALANEQQVILPGRADTLYVWMDDGSGYITGQTPDGAFAVNNGNNHLRSVATIDGGAFSSSVNWIVQAEKAGRVVAWETPARGGGLASVRWSKELGVTIPQKSYQLSSPSVGDVDGDGEPEVVVTNHHQLNGPDSNDELVMPDGEVFVLDADPPTSTGVVEASLVDESWVFRSENRWHPPRRPVLACLDSGTSGLEIVVGSATLKGGTVEATATTAVVLEVNGSGGLDDLACDSEVTIPGRYGGTSVRVGPWSQSTILDLDGIGGLDMLMPTNHPDLVAFSYDEASGSCAETAGWPLRMSDFALATTATSEGLLVVDEGGAVQYLDLAGGLGDVADGWPQYGYDDGNTAFHPDCTTSRPALIESMNPRVTSLRVSPNPVRGAASLLLNVPQAGEAEVGVYDIQGRRVRLLLEGPSGPGVAVLQWDGTDSQGNRVANGVYFARARTVAGSDETRFVLLR